MADAIGRWIVSTFYFRFTGLISMAVVHAFVVWKGRRDPSAISTTSCLSVAFSVFTIISATNAGAIFLLTSPPALDLLSKDSLALVAVVTVIAVYQQAGRDIVSRFRNPPAPPQNHP